MRQVRVCVSLALPWKGNVCRLHSERSIGHSSHTPQVASLHRLVTSQALCAVCTVGSLGTRTRTCCSYARQGKTHAQESRWTCATAGRRAGGQTWCCASRRSADCAHLRTQNSMRGAFEETGAPSRFAARRVRGLASGRMAHCYASLPVYLCAAHLDLCTCVPARLALLHRYLVAATASSFALFATSGLHRLRATRLVLFVESVSTLLDFCLERESRLSFPVVTL